MVSPLHRIVGLAALVAIFFVVSGLIRLSRLVATRSRAPAWTIMTGVVALLLGLSVWIGWPVEKLWFVGLCIAIDFICHGISWCGLAISEEKSPPKPAM